MVSYAHAEGVLARLHGATGEPQRKAFRARLKHLRKLGIPLGINPGRGKKVEYDEDALYQWIFCLELAEFGIDPSHIVRILRENWKEIKKNFNAEASRDFDDELLFVLLPSFMGEAMVGAPPYSIKWYRGSGPDLFYKLRSHRRAILINLTHFLRGISLAEVASQTEISRKEH